MKHTLPSGEINHSLCVHGIKELADINREFSEKNAGKVVSGNDRR